MGASGRLRCLSSTKQFHLFQTCFIILFVGALGRSSALRRAEADEPNDDISFLETEIIRFGDDSKHVSQHDSGTDITEPVLPGCSVLDCGAFGGGLGDDTEAFRHCWKACSTVTVPAGDYLVAQLDLPGTDKVLKLLDGARILAPGPDSRHMYGRVFEDWYTLALKDCTRCAIVGAGNATIDGRAHLWVNGMITGDRKNVTNWPDSSCHSRKQCRPRLLGVVSSSDVMITNIQLVDSVFWTTHVVNSSDVILSNLNIWGDYDIPNNDGIDIDSSENIEVRDVNIDTADDAICIKTTHEGVATRNVLVTGGTLASRSSAIKFGSESHGDFSNITIENLEVMPSHRAIGVQLRDGGSMSGLTVRNVRLTAHWQVRTWWGAAEAILITRLPRHTASGHTGRLQDMLISNVSGISEAGVVIVGHKDLPIEKVVLANLNLKLGNLTKFAGGYRDLRPGPADIEKAAPAALYARNVQELVVSDSVFEVPGGVEEREDWGFAWQPGRGVASATLTNVQVIDQR